MLTAIVTTAPFAGILPSFTPKTACSFPFSGTVSVLELIWMLATSSSSLSICKTVEGNRLYPWSEACPDAVNVTLNGTVPSIILLSIPVTVTYSALDHPTSSGEKTMTERSRMATLGSETSNLMVTGFSGRELINTRIFAVFPFSPTWLVETVTLKSRSEDWNRNNLNALVKVRFVQGTSLSLTCYPWPTMSCTLHQHKIK